MLISGLNDIPKMWRNLDHHRDGTQGVQGAHTLEEGTVAFTKSTWSQATKIRPALCDAAQCGRCRSATGRHQGLQEISAYEIADHARGFRENEPTNPRHAAGFCHSHDSDKQVG